jgi:hypothetical protein
MTNIVDTFSLSLQEKKKKEEEEEEKKLQVHMNFYIYSQPHP